jgi:hypothetical protein
MPRYCPRCGEALHSDGTTKGEVRKTARRAFEKPEPMGKKVRKASAYSKKYGRAFKKVSKKYKKKSGGWKKDGFKRAQKAAHKLAKR